MTHCRTQRPGYVLVAVLMVIVVLSLTAYRFADSMSSEFQVAYRSAEAAKTRSFAISGIHYTMGALADPNILTGTLAGNPYDDESFFSAIPVGPASPRGGGMFSIVSLLDNQDGSNTATVRYGVTDEGGKINLNSMMRIDPSGQTLWAMLMLLPNMTQDVADSIVDWLDADDEARTSGAESDYYQGLSPPYMTRNGSLNSIEELLLVKGVTPALLFGTDRNRNGQQDNGESGDSGFSRGWVDYITIYGRELNVDSSGNPRVYVNGSDLSSLNQSLVTPIGQAMADYVVAYRMYSSSPTTNPMPNNSKKGTASDLRTAVSNSLSNSPKAARSIPNTLLSLRGTRVTLPAVPSPPSADPRQPTPAPQTIVVDCPLNDNTTFNSVVAAMLDATTAKSSYELNPRINVSTASQTLISVLPGLTADTISAAISAQANITPGTPEYNTGAWMVTQAGMTPEIFVQLAPYVTGYTMTYRVQSIGYFAQGGPVSRVEAVIDTNAGQPRIVYFRDISELGGGFTPPRP